MAVIITLGLSARSSSANTTPPLPKINTNLIFDVTNTVFAGGALGNGISNSTAAIQAAINTASTASASGATVRIRAVGVNTNYLCGPLKMASHVNLMIDSGTKLQMFPMSSWPSPDSNFINGATLTDAEISGTGTIDGQGTNWWFPLASSRPNFIEFDHCTRVLIQDVTLQNPPTFTIYLKNSDTSVTIQRITINTPYDSHNTDGFDISSTNVLIQSSFISTGDDDVELGGSGAETTDITISNCTFGTGHGVSMGSKIGGGVNNVIVSNCTWNGTEYGVKAKSDRGIGGLVQNIHYFDLNMTNVNFPIAFYMDYNTLGSPSKSITITPAQAAADTSQSTNSSTPIYRNITITNLTAVGNNGIQGPGNIACILYGLPESPVTNVTLYNVNILGRGSDGTFDVYHARGIQIVNSNLTAPSVGTNTLTLYNAGITITNSSANANLVTLGGLGSPSNTVLAFFNAQASITDTNLDNPNPNLTLAASTLTVNNLLKLGNSSTLNFGIGANATKIPVTGNLTIGGTFNISNAGGFTNATYTLLTYSGALTDNGVTIGSIPNATFTYAVDTDTVGIVKLDVISPSCGVGAAGPISGASSVAAGTNGVVYSVSSASGATAYTWIVPSGVTIASGQGTTSITVNYACSAVSGNITVTPSNGGCSGTSSSLLEVTVTNVGAAGSISGASSIASGANGVTYSISSVSGATTYTWTVPSGASISSGQGTTSITVNYPCSAVGGNVQVTPGNANGCIGVAGNLSVTVTPVGVAGTITGPPSANAGANGVSYSISSVGGATTYTWTVPSGASIISGQGTTSVTVNFGCAAVSGNVQVTPGNANGCTGISNSLSVTVNANPATFNVTGGGSYCSAGGGVTIGLDGSESSADYRLELNGNPTGSLLAGTGGAISFTNQTSVGSYTVIASNVTTGCTATMNGSASVTLGDPFTCWQLQYFGCTNCPQADANADPDGDGQNNMAEFLAGTVPTNSTSVLAIVSVVKSGADVNVTWTTAGGHTNIVQVTSGDGSGNYITNNFADIAGSLTILPGSGGDTTTNYVDTGGATNIPSRYYRIRLVQ